MSTSYEATGRVVAILDTEQVNDTFKKREFAIQIEDGQYPQQVKFQVVQDKTTMLDNFKEGQEVKVLFNLRGREFERKSDGRKDYWLNLDAWRIEALGEQPASNDKTDTFKDDVPF